MGLFDDKVNYAVQQVVKKWLDNNTDILLDNISNSIQTWLDDHKKKIFEIIKEEIKKQGD